MIQWSDNSAYWTFSLVNNWAYTRYNLIHPEIELYQQELENKFIKESVSTDKKALEIYNSNKAEGLNFITQFSVNTGNQLVSDWMQFFRYLFMKYVDGNMKKTADRKLLDNGNGKGIPPKPGHPGYGKNWERKIVENTGTRFIVR